MVSSAATTVDDYLASMDPDRREIISALRETVVANLQPGFVEAMSFGMCCYEIPLAVSGPTYNGKPLVYIGIANQKQSVSLYLTAVYMQPQVLARFTADWTAAGARLDMGKSCVRIRRLSEVPLDVVAWVAGLVSPAEFLEQSNAARSH